MSDLLKRILYCLDGRRCDLADGNNGDADEWIRHIDNAYSDYVDNIEYENGWISVEDRLPEKYSWYMIVSNTKVTMAFYDGDTVNEDGGLWLVHNDNPDNDEWENVTHWMPLPEPPKQ